MFKTMKSEQNTEFLGTQLFWHLQTLNANQKNRNIFTHSLPKVKLINFANLNRNSNKKLNWSPLSYMRLQKGSPYPPPLLSSLLHQCVPVPLFNIALQPEFEIRDILVRILIQLWIELLSSLILRMQKKKNFSYFFLITCPQALIFRQKNLIFC